MELDEQRYDIWQDGRKQAAKHTAAEAAARLGIPVADLEWAIEEHGRADIAGMTAKKAGSKKPAEWSDWHFARMG